MKKCKLIDICTPKQWKTIPTSELMNSGYPVYGANGVIGYYRDYNHEKPTVTITCRGATCGNINLTIPQSYVTSNAMCLDNVDENVLVKYLYYAMRAFNFTKVISGSAQPQITRENLQKVEICVYSIEKQSMIVNHLEAVERLIHNRKMQLEKLYELVQSRFIELFSGKKYNYVKTSDVCDFITKGTTPRSDEIFEEYEAGRVPYLKVYNLSLTGALLFDDAPQYINISTHEEKLARSKVYPNDVLMNIVGPPLGKFALVTNEFDEWNINQAIAIFRPREKVIPKFLMAALMQPDVLQPFLQQAVGIRQLNLSLEQCRNLEIPLPPIELQQQFATFVEEVDKSKSAIQKSLDELEILKKSLMQKYFG